MVDFGLNDRHKASELENRLCWDSFLKRQHNPENCLEFSVCSFRGSVKKRYPTLCSFGLLRRYYPNLRGHTIVAMGCAAERTTKKPLFTFSSPFYFQGQKRKNENDANPALELSSLELAGPTKCERYVWRKKMFKNSLAPFDISTKRSKEGNNARKGAYFFRKTRFILFFLFKSIVNFARFRTFIVTSP